MTQQPNATQPINVLAVEDSPTQGLMIKYAMDDIPRLHLLELLTDGKQATAYLKRDAPFQDATRPDLVLLDINMPHLDGFAVLRTIKSDESLRSIPVVMLTSSESEEDIEQAYNEGAASFIPKPVAADKLNDTLKLLAEFFSGAGRLPGRKQL